MNVFEKNARGGGMFAYLHFSSNIDRDCKY